MARKSTKPIGDLKLALRAHQTKNALVNELIHDWAQREILVSEIKQLFEIANKCGIDWRLINESAIALALEIARKFIPGFTPSMDTRGNPRDAEKLHGEVLTCIRSEVAQDKTIREAAEAYIKSKNRIVTPTSVKRTAGQYHRARKRECDRSTTEVDEIAMVIGKALARKRKRFA